MAALGMRRIHIAFMDSRGQGLQEEVNKRNTDGEYLEIRSYSGRTLRGVTDYADNYLKQYPYDVIYICGGVNDITSKDKKTKIITYEWEKGKDLEDHLLSELKRAEDTLKKNHPGAKVIFCPIVGLLLERVLTNHTATLDQQTDVENAVWDFNSKIFEINNGKNLFTPALHHQVHRFTRGIRRAYYHHLGDGLHPTPNLLSKWADQFVKSKARN